MWIFLSRGLVIDQARKDGFHIFNIDEIAKHREDTVLVEAGESNIVQNELPKNQAPLIYDDDKKQGSKSSQEYIERL